MGIERTGRQTATTKNRPIDWNSLHLLVMLIGPATVMALILFLWPDVRWVAEMPYAATGILGSVAAVLLSIFTIARYREKPGVPYISAGLLVIGILGGAQSLSSPGSSLFVWLHTLAGVISSAFFTTYVLSQIKNTLILLPTDRKLGSLLTGTVAGSILLGGASAIFAQSLPVMIEAGRFTTLAWIMNTVPVGLFLFTGIYLSYRTAALGTLSCSFLLP